MYCAGVSAVLFLLLVLPTKRLYQQSL